ncbi:MAG: hypothetical protein ACP5IL_04460 [Syntrophobacteraceae bacterium]
MWTKPLALVSLLSLCFLCIIAFAGCGPNTKGLVGTYKAETQDPSLRGRLSMVLKESGVGVWKIGDDELSFSWHVKDSELRLYTRNGGVIVGKLKGRLIEIALPGFPRLTFERTS